jgi:hypothetical protein
MKILFLDFDGVLNTHRNIDPDPEIFSPAACANLSKLLSDEPDLVIVVSSAWRHGGKDYVRNILSKNGIARSRVVGVTGNEPGCRGDQIKAWLDAHDELPIESFVIFDDENDMGPVLDRLVKTQSYIGLTSEHVEDAKKILATAY